MLSNSTPLAPLLDIDSILAPRRPPFGAGSKPGEEQNTQVDKRAAARILVVEDDWFAGMDIQSSLQDAGYQVLDLAASAEQAIEAAGEHEPDIVIMDVRLAGERDGIDAALEIARRFDIRCLFLTAYSDPGLRSRAEAARPFGWLTKPIPGEALIAAVRDALARR